MEPSTESNVKMGQKKKRKKKGPVRTGAAGHKLDQDE